MPPRVPNMPLFEPSHDQAANLLMQRVEQSGQQIGEGQRQFSFPADEAFWDNFTTQAALNTAAVREPLFSVSASHDPKQHNVNQQWMRNFVGAWEQQNPHTVTVTQPDGAKSFYASDDFWRQVVAKLAATPGTVRGGGAPGPGEVVVASGGDAIRCPQQVWDDACNQWEANKNCTPAERAQQLAQRHEEGEQFKERAAAQQPGGGFAEVPLPGLDLSAEDFQNVSPPSSRGSQQDGEEEFDFPADENFWRNLQRAIRNTPGADDGPAFLIDAGDGQRATVGRDFLRQFMKAWNRTYPFVVTLAMRHNGELQSTVFNANQAVWGEMVAVAVGQATEELKQHIPDGFLLAHCSNDPADDPPIVLEVRDWHNICALWQPQTDDGTTGQSRSYQTHTSSGYKHGKGRPHAPCVKLPKADGSEPRRRRAPLPAGAVPRRERRCDAPTVTLMLHQGIFDGMNAARQKVRPTRHGPVPVVRRPVADQAVGTTPSLYGDDAPALRRDGSAPGLRPRDGAAHEYGFGPPPRRAAGF